MLMLNTNCSRKSTGETKHIKLSGDLIKIGQYCGGAPPNPKLLEEIRSPKPLAKYPLYIKKGKENKLDTPIFKELYTDDSGSFSVELPKGDYVLLSKEQVDRSIFEKTPYIQIQDREALEEWWKKGLLSFNKDTHFENTFRERCSLPLGVPHLRYTGPVAP